ncbi:GNAT family N-acetyltransferase [Virgibacillus necropolis]|uniref:GNAT family N-acetyltransferase n=1 Tax=Virgibacillus necropolis TaxID=163877 RepID=UPI00384CD170
MVIQKLGVQDNPPMDLLLSADPSRELIEKYLQKGQCFIAKIESEIVGVYVLLPINSATVELINIAVAEGIQGKGIGKQLTLHAIENANSQGYKAIEVGTGNSSIGQLALYQKCGFRIFGVEHDFFVKHYSEKIMENGIHCRDMIRLKINFEN